MSTSTCSDVFTDVVNSLTKELDAAPCGSNAILHLVTNNPDSPVLAEIKELSLANLGTKEMIALVAALAKMTGLVSLDLSRCEPSPGHFKFLFTECTALSKLQSLHLSFMRAMTSEDLLALSRSTTLMNLTSLSLVGCTAASSRNVSPSRPGQKPADSMIALFTSPVVKNLTHLNLGCADIDDSQIHITIATSPFLSNLVSLELAHIQIDSDAIAAFAASTTLTNLTHLNLSSVWFGDEMTQLFSPPSRLAQKLQSLDLTRTELTVSSLEAVIEASPHLTELVLEGNDELGSDGAALVATSMPNLIQLNLVDCGIGDEGFSALAASSSLSNLRKLNLNWNLAEAESIIALVNSPVMANLTHLELDSTHSGPEVLTAIAQSQQMSNLQHLMFSFNRTGDDGVMALTQSTTLTNLTSLHLGGNEIGPGGISVLCTSPMVTKLTSLDLQGSPEIGDSLASTLAAPTSTLYNLLELNVSNVGLSDQGVLQLLATPNLNQLDALCIRVNDTTQATCALYRARFGRDI